jgi:hypothetical protein
MNRRLLCLLHVNLFHTNTATKESEKPKREKNARCARPGRAQLSSNFNYSKHFKVSPQTQHSTKPTATVELHTTAADDTDKHKRSTMAPLDASPAPSKLPLYFHPITLSTLLNQASSSHLTHLEEPYRPIQ